MFSWFGSSLSSYTHFAADSTVGELIFRTVMDCSSVSKLKGNEDAKEASELARMLLLLSVCTYTTLSNFFSKARAKLRYSCSLGERVLYLLRTCRMTSCESLITFNLLALRSRAIRSPRMSASYSAMLLLAEKSSSVVARRTAPSRVRSVALIPMPYELSAPSK